MNTDEFMKNLKAEPHITQISADWKSGPQITQMDIFENLNAEPQIAQICAD